MQSSKRQGENLFVMWLKFALMVYFVKYETSEEGCLLLSSSPPPQTPGSAIYTDISQKNIRDFSLHHNLISLISDWKEADIKKISKELYMPDFSEIQSYKYKLTTDELFCICI